jgi:4-carboxymuconolactone decarboxylase
MSDTQTAKKLHTQAMLFPIGQPNAAYAQYFTGESFLAPISTKQINIFNVTFAPGCRNNWHIHHAQSGGGQILVCVAGQGLYQEWGQPAVILSPGDVVNIPSGVKHWHGAVPGSWFSHLSIEVPGSGTENEWLEPVTDADYLAQCGGVSDV